MTEDEIISWHYQLNGHEFEQALGDGEEQGLQRSDMTERVNNNNKRSKKKKFTWIVSKIQFHQ